MTPSELREAIDLALPWPSLWTHAQSSKMARAVIYLSEQLKIAEGVCEAAEAYELWFLRTGKSSEKMSAAYAAALKVWREGK